VRALVVNADDFGLSAGVNAGVLRAHRDGIVTSASLMVRQSAAAPAAAASVDHPRLSLGLHVDLAEWAQHDGDWRLRYAWVDDSDAGAVRGEIEEQIETFRRLVGRPPTHLDSHQHVHRGEPVRSILGAIARDLGVPLRHHSPVRYCGSFYGQSRSGEPLPAAIGPETLTALIRELPEGATELCCHPAERVDPTWAYGDERTVELDSLCDAAVRRALAEADVRLANFENVTELLARDPEA
jgi:predicted glycoside hydrolase/deacetylase ChbG (UPF0249 family)